MGYDPQRVVVLQHRISKARSYGERTSSGSLGQMSDAQYDESVRGMKRKRNRALLGASLLSGGISGGATYGINRASRKGPRGGRLGRLTAGAAAVGAALPVGVSSIGLARQERSLRSPATRRQVEERLYARRAMAAGRM